MKYYFTYGSGGQPFVGGWTVVHAEDCNEAVDKFNIVHPPKDGFINCAFVYPEDAFVETSMYKNGNFGRFAWEEIGVEE